MQRRVQAEVAERARPLGFAAVVSLFAGELWYVACLILSSALFYAHWRAALSTGGKMTRRVAPSPQRVSREPVASPEEIPLSALLWGLYALLCAVIYVCASLSSARCVLGLHQ